MSALFVAEADRKQMQSLPLSSAILFHRNSSNLWATLFNRALLLRRRYLLTHPLILLLNPTCTRLPPCPRILQRIQSNQSVAIAILTIGYANALKVSVWVETSPTHVDGQTYKLRTINANATATSERNAVRMHSHNTQINCRSAAYLIFTCIVAIRVCKVSLREGGITNTWSMLLTRQFWSAFCILYSCDMFNTHCSVHSEYLKKVH